MFSLSLYFGVASLCGVLASILSLNPVLELPTNVSRSMADLSNHTLDSAWPSRLPWPMRLHKDLIMEIKQYGEYAPRSDWSAICLALSEIIAGLNRQQGGPHTTFSSPFYQTENMVIYSIGSIEKWEVLKVMQRVEDLFCVFRENPFDPRAFTAEIKAQRPPREMAMQLYWIHKHHHWNPYLPWRTWWGPPSGELTSLQFYEYGRDIDPSLAEAVREALEWVKVELEDEGAENEFTNKEAYWHGFVNMTIGRPSPGVEKAKVMRSTMIDVVESIEVLYFEPSNWGPREFAAHLEERDSPAHSWRLLGDIFLEWMG